jgi:hypothetical protein
VVPFDGQVTGERVAVRADGSTLVVLKVIVGYLSISRTFDERRSLSRISLWVRMLAVWMVTCTEDFLRVVGIDVGDRTKADVGVCRSGYRQHARIDDGR